jgi:hypothetical protein
MDRAVEMRLLALDAENLVAPVEDRAVRPEHQLRPGIAVAEAVVAHAQCKVGPGQGAVDRGLGIGEAGRRPVGSDLRPPDIVSAQPGRRGDDVGDLAGESGYVQRRAVDDLDPGDVRRADPAQLGEDIYRLAREALAVDQHVARGLAEAASVGVGLVDSETGHVVEHVERVSGREAGEEFGRVGAPALRVRRIGRGRSLRVRRSCIACRGLGIACGGLGIARGRSIGGWWFGVLGDRGRGRAEQGDREQRTAAGLPVEPLHKVSLA